MGLSSKKLLAIDWDRKNLRLVLVRPHADGVDLLKAVSVPIPSDVVMDSAESLGVFLREAMRQAKVGAKRAILGVPRDQVVLNTLNLPASPAEQLASIVQFQIVKELPFAADQATLDFAVCGEFDPREPSRVLVAAVRNDQLEFYRKVAYEAGLTIERVGLRPHANLIAVMTRAPELEKKSVLAVEVGPQLTEIDIINDGVLAFSRAASVSLPDFERLQTERLRDSRIESVRLEEREPDEANRKAVGAMMVEVIRSFEAYRATESTASVDQVIVCGATGIEPQLAESLAGRFAVGAGLYAPDRALNLTPQRAKELRGFSAALGLALGHGGQGLSHFDFLHPKRPVSKRSIRMKKVPTAVLAAALVVASGATFHFKYISPEQKKLAALTEQVNSLRKQERIILDFKDQVEAMEDWQKSEQYWPEVLVEVTEVFPSDQEAFVMRLTGETKRPKKKGTIRPSTMTMKLHTSDLAKVNELAERLKKLWSTEVEVGRETPLGRRSESSYSYDTSIEVELPLRKRPEAADQPEESVDEDANGSATSGAGEAGKPKSGKGIGTGAGAAPASQAGESTVASPERPAGPVKPPGTSSSRPAEGAVGPKGGA